MDNKTMQVATDCVARDAKFRNAFSKFGGFGFVAYMVAAIQFIKSQTGLAFDATLNAIATAKQNGEKPSDETLSHWVSVIRESFADNVAPTLPKRLASFMGETTFRALYDATTLPVKRDTAKHGQHGLKPKNNVNHRIATEMVDSHSVKLTAYVNNAIVGTLIVAFAEYRNGFGLQTVTDFYGNVYEMKSDQHRVLELINRLGCDSLREYYANEFIGYFVNRGSKRPDGTSFTGGAIRNLAGKCRPNTGK